MTRVLSVIFLFFISCTIETLKSSTLSVLQDFRDDGAVYLELRTTPRTIPSSGITKDDYVSIILDCIQDFGQAKMSTCLILSVDRRNSATEAMEVAGLAIKYRSRGVVALDLCGDPSKGDVSDYREAFMKAKDHGLKLTLHFAEVPSSSVAKELETLLSYGPDRIGHVIHVPDSIKREIVARKLGLELCLSCNIHAKLITGGFANHHFGYWKDQPCPIILCTDDVGIFCSSLSNEYLLAAQHFDLNRHDMVELCKGGIETIFEGEQEKHKLRESLTAFVNAESL